MYKRTPLHQPEGHTKAHGYLEEELPAPQVISQDIEHPHHLREDEDSVSSLLQTHQQFVQKNQLSTATDQLL